MLWLQCSSHYQVPCSKALLVVLDTNQSKARIVPARTVSATHINQSNACGSFVSNAALAGSYAAPIAWRYFWTLVVSSGCGRG